MINTNVLRKAMREIAANRGNFTLFALLMRADGPGTWDLVVSAPWLESGKFRATSEFVRLLAQSIGEESLQQFSRVLALNSADAPLSLFWRTFRSRTVRSALKIPICSACKLKKGSFFVP